MKYITKKYIYYVDFNPTQSGEFASSHLAVVLALNKDNKTVLVAPLTSDSNVYNSLKLNLGVLDCLPSRLKKSDTHVVIDHCRNVSISRFTTIREGPALMDDANFNLIARAYSDRCLSVFNQTQQREYVYNQFETHLEKEIMNDVYAISRMIESDSIIVTSVLEAVQKKITLLQMFNPMNKSITEDRKIQQILELISDNAVISLAPDLDSISLTEKAN